MKGNTRQYSGRLRENCESGYTLVELMIVLVIAGILATGVVFMFANPGAKSKNQAFTLLGDLNMARSEAVNRNEDVLIDFIFGTADGYQICVDSNGLNGCSDETGDNFIRETIFPEDVQYYDPTAQPAGGPATTPNSGSIANNLIGDTGVLEDDGDSVSSFTMESDGTLEDGLSQDINVVVYVPESPTQHNEIYGAPYSVTINSSTGSIRISRWTEGAWKTK